MAVERRQDLLSAADYLEGEKSSPVRHEFLAGRVYAMAGASDAHATLAGNLFALLHSHLRGSGCRVYMADMKVRVAAAGAFYYPDLLVTGDPRDRELDYYKEYPRLLAEVLSPSTEAIDRGNKFAHYRQLESLEEYVLIAQDRIALDSFRRNAQGRWELYPYTGDGPARLASLDFSCSPEQLYEDVRL